MVLVLVMDLGLALVLVLVLGLVLILGLVLGLPSSMRSNRLERTDPHLHYDRARSSAPPITIAIAIATGCPYTTPSLSLYFYHLENPIALTRY